MINKGNGYLYKPVLTAMREVAYGSDTVRATNKTIDRAERMRDDDMLLSKAEQKRLDKQAKRLLRGK